MKLLIIDNYDSFTFNLVQIIEEHGSWDFDVLKNDKVSISKVSDYDKIIFSPGPGVPDDSMLMKIILSEYYSSKSILGICLGHQAIADFLEPH